jgi:hypothetical protein
VNKAETAEFNSRGFLSPFIDTRVLQFRQKLAPWVNFFDTLNNFAHSTLSKCQVEKRESVRLLALSALSRAIENYQAARLLAERGMDKQSKAAQRSLLEDTFVIAACAHSPTTAETYIRADEGERRKRVNSLLGLPDAQKNLSAHQIAELRQDNRGEAM